MKLSLNDQVKQIGNYQGKQVSLILHPLLDIKK